MRPQHLLASMALGSAAALIAGAPASAATPQFTEAPTAVSAPASSAVSADFNGDGVPDVVFLQGGSAVIQYGVAGAPATFTKGPTYTSARWTYTHLTTGDFNGDGRTDLAISGFDTATPTTGSVGVAFTSQSGLPADRPALSVYERYTFDDLGAADLDRGGRSQLIAVARVPSASGPTGVIFSRDVVTGNYAAFKLTSQEGAADGRLTLAVDDFDGDGFPDAAWTTGDNINLFYGTGSGVTPVNGAYRTFSSYWTAKTAPGTTELKARDLDGSGSLDLVARRTRTLTTWIEPGFRGFATPRTTALFASGDAFALADVDDDGRIDALADDGTGAVDLHLGDGNGVFGARTSVSPSPGASGPFSSLITSDLDGNGTLDLVSTSASKVVRFVNTGSGAAARAALISELRFSGPQGSGDQYVQVYNPGTTPLGLGGWTLRSSTGASVTIPETTVVPAAGHLLLSTPSSPTGYSLSDSGMSTVGIPVGFLSDASLEGGVALVDPYGVTRDAVGVTGAGAGYVNGTPLRPFTAVGQSAYVRRFSAGVPVNSGDNASDFVAVDTKADGTQGSILGAPRPDSLTSPTMKNDFLQSSPIDLTKAASQSPNRVVTAATADAPATLTINRTITNCSGTAKTATATKPVCTNAATVEGVTVTKLRFRITALSTRGNTPRSDMAVLRAVASADAVPGGIAVNGLPVDKPSETTGGGLNSSLTATALIPVGLAPGASVKVAFTFVVENPGAYTFGFNTEDDLVEGDEVPATFVKSSAGLTQTALPTATVDADDDAPAAPASAVTPSPSAQPSPGPVVAVNTPSSQLAVETATETVHGVIPASAVAAATSSTAAAAKPSTTKPAATTSKKATCQVTKTTKSKTKAQSKKSTKPCTTKKTTKAKPTTSAKKKTAAKK